MKNKRNLGFRIWVLFSIVLFVLIPLLSSPVAAAFTFDVSTAYTDNTSGGPTVWWSGTNNPGAYSSLHANPPSATFTCTFNFSDTSGNINIPSSSHYGELNVYQRNSGTFQGKDTGVIYLNNGQSTSVTLSISDTYNSNNRPIIWDISVYVYCEDIPTQTAVWNTWSWTYTVT
jgi:hypothetical protein